MIQITKEERQKEIEGLLFKVKQMAEGQSKVILNRFKAVDKRMGMLFLRNALKMNVSPRQAIKLQCNECMGYCDNARDEIKNCTAYGCSLWHHRPYQKKS